MQRPIVDERQRVDRFTKTPLVLLISIAMHQDGRTSHRIDVGSRVFGNIFAKKSIF